jgi:hypothetical protein
MKGAFAAFMIAMSAILFVNSAGAQPRRHHHNRVKQCKRDCKEAYRMCKRSHGRRCGEIRHECERGCR